MARPIKKGLDYFPLDCVLDTKIQLVEAEFGLKGFALLIKLFQKIYGEQGYYCEWNSEVALLFASKCGAGGTDVSELIECCLRRGIFDKGLYEAYGILTSSGIQKRYCQAKRCAKESIKNEYLLLNAPKNGVIATKTRVSATKTQVIAAEMTQSKVKESKVNKSKEKESICEQVQDLFNDTCVSLPRVRILSDSRKRIIKARLNEYGFEKIKDVFIRAQHSDFLTGNNNKGWTADFDWLLAPRNFIKVLEGNYDNRGRQGGNVFADLLNEMGGDIIDG